MHPLVKSRVLSCDAGNSPGTVFEKCARHGHDYSPADASPNASTCVMPAKRISLIVREPSGFVVYITESRSYLTERSVHFPWVVAITFLPLLNVTVASGLCDTQLTSYNPAAIGTPLTEAG